MNFGRNIRLDVEELNLAVKLRALAVLRGRGEMKDVDDHDFIRRTTVHWRSKEAAIEAEPLEDVGTGKAAGYLYEAIITVDEG